MANTSQTLQILFVHFTYLLYSAYLSYRLWVAAEETGHDINGTIPTVAAWSTAYVALNIYLIMHGLTLS